VSPRSCRRVGQKGVEEGPPKGVQSAARAFPRRGATVRLPLRGQGSAPGLAPRRMGGTGHRPLTAARLEREIVFPRTDEQGLGPRAVVSSRLRPTAVGKPGGGVAERGPDAFALEQRSTALCLSGPPPRSTGRRADARAVTVTPSNRVAWLGSVGTTGPTTGIWRRGLEADLPLRADGVASGTSSRATQRAAQSVFATAPPSEPIASFRGVATDVVAPLAHAGALRAWPHAPGTAAPRLHQESCLLPITRQACQRPVYRSPNAG
jgi:hypothetical protein